MRIADKRAWRTGTVGRVGSEVEGRVGCRGKGGGAENMEAALLTPFRGCSAPALSCLFMQACERVAALIFDFLGWVPPLVSCAQARRVFVAGLCRQLQAATGAEALTPSPITAAATAMPAAATTPGAAAEASPSASPSTSEAALPPGAPAPALSPTHSGGAEPGSVEARALRGEGGVIGAWW